VSAGSYGGGTHRGVRYAQRMNLRPPAFVTLAALGLISVSGCASVPSASCDTAFASASAKLENDAELFETLLECNSVDDWVAGLKANPAAGSLITYSTDDAHEFLNLICIRQPEAELCAEASSRGILDFDLDDPRLRDLD